MIEVVKQTSRTFYKSKDLSLEERKNAVLLETLRDLGFDVRYNEFLTSDERSLLCTITLFKEGGPI